MWTQKLLVLFNFRKSVRIFLSSSIARQELEYEIVSITLVQIRIKVFFLPPSKGFLAEFTFEAPFSCMSD